MSKISVVCDPPMGEDDPHGVPYRCDEPGCKQHQTLPAEILFDCVQPIYCADHSEPGHWAWAIPVGRPQ